MDGHNDKFKAFEQILNVSFTKPFKPGDKVTFKGYGLKEHGIVKSYNVHNNYCIFVVYACNNDWDNYDQYTGQSTGIKYLRHGWL